MRLTESDCLFPPKVRPATTTFRRRAPPLEGPWDPERTSVPGPRSGLAKFLAANPRALTTSELIPPAVGDTAAVLTRQKPVTRCGGTPPRNNPHSAGVHPLHHQNFKFMNEEVMSEIILMYCCYSEINQASVSRAARSQKVSVTELPVLLRASVTSLPEPCNYCTNANQEQVPKCLASKLKFLSNVISVYHGNVRRSPHRTAGVSSVPALQHITPLVSLTPIKVAISEYQISGIFLE